MNLILLDIQPSDTRIWIPMEDSRATHIKTVLKMQAGDTCFVGLPQGAAGQATIKSLDTEGLWLSIQWNPVPPPPLYPIHLLVGLPRPQTARKILQTCASLGIAHITFFQSEKGELSYAQSTLWTTLEWQTHLKQGAEQACATTFPSVNHAPSLEAACTLLPIETRARIALDIYEAQKGLMKAEQIKTPILLALGAERGWSAGERETLRTHGFTLAHLGPRVLRTETACVAAISVCLSRLAWA